MTERTVSKTDAVDRSTANSDAQLAFGRIGDRQVRIDTAHATFVGSVPPEALATPTPPVAPVIAAVAPARESGSLRRDAQWLMEASQLMQQCSTRMVEIDERAAELDQREQQFELRARVSFDQFTQRELEIAGRERQLAARMASLDTQEALLADALHAQAEDRAQLDHARRELGEAQAAVESRVTAQLESRSRQLDSEAARLQDLAEILLQQQAEMQIQAQDTLRLEREQLWTALTSEWEEHRASFDREKTTWQTEAQSAQDQWHSEHDEARVVLEKLQLDLLGREQAIAATEDALIRREEANLLLQRELHQKQHEAEQGFSQLFAERQGQWEESHRQATEDLARERSLWENRLRFQQDHLEKLRAELERQQQEFRAERQRETQRLNELDAIGQRSRQQLEAFRTALDERERSIGRDVEFGDLLKFAANRLQELEARAVAESSADQNAALQTLRRQQEAITLQLEQLDTRRQRLDMLRSELEETHRSTLEIRLAVEDAWAQLAHHFGDEAARERVEQARDTLASFYDKLRQQVSEQQRTMLESQAQLETQRAEHLEERQQLHDWMIRRDEELSVRDQQLREEFGLLERHELTWQHIRTRWINDRLHAETVIRRLLDDAVAMHRGHPHDSLPVIPSQEFVETQLAALANDEIAPPPMIQPYQPTTPSGSLHE